MREERRIGAGLFLMSFGFMAVEMAMIRVFDFVFTRNLSFLIISGALFSLGLAGVRVSLARTSSRRQGSGIQGLRGAALAFGISVLAIRPGLNALAFEPQLIVRRPAYATVLLLCLGVLLCVPFFSTGLFFARVFSSYAEIIGSLYAVDLVGAALGAVLVLPVLPLVGPGGILNIAGALALAVAAFLSPPGWFQRMLAIGSVGVIVAVLLVPRSPADFTERVAKGDGLSERLRAAQASGQVEYSVWDPISRIDVLPAGSRKEVAYDGGSQATTLFGFDGDFDKLRSSSGAGVYEHFWNRGVLAAHYLRQGHGSKVLVIGAGGGQEVKAALLYGASEVDAVEMVGAVVDLAATRFSDFIGRLFSRPGVRVWAGEGRTYLRNTRKRYDIIQIYSSHTTSSLASGSGAMDVSYLLTAEAFAEYFEHLEPSGVLQVNHPLYPRLVTTAARGWTSLGREGFRRHVLVYQRDPARSGDWKPTFMVKMDPWTRQEVRQMDDFFASDFGERVPWVKAEDPLEPGTGMLSAAFFEPRAHRSLQEAVPYRIEPATDDRPFFKFARTQLAPLSVDARRFTDRAVAEFANPGSFLGVPLDVLHLVALGLLTFCVAVPAALAPLVLSRAGRKAWRGKGSAITYFALLGTGFIVIELVFIQKCMKIIGYPLHAFSAVVVALLVSAGCGSMLSSRVPLGKGAKAVFPAILVVGVLCLVVFPEVAGAAMQWGTWARSLAVGLLMCPLGLLLGMPFPFGIRAVSTAGASAVAWAWGVNGLATVVGGLVSVVASMFLGFDSTLLLAFALYPLAGILFHRLERLRPEGMG